MVEINFINEFNASGNSYGYATHQKNIRDALIRNGVTISNFADICLHITPACSFKPVIGKKNVLYTMYEMDTLPPNWYTKFKDVDLFIVPCQQNKELFSRYTDKPIEVCSEGCDTDYFNYIDRHNRDKTNFIFLWLGANNVRKGWLNIAYAWEEFRKLIPKAMLVIKTTPNREDTQEVCELDRENSIILDSRHLGFDREGDTPALREVYHRADAFLMPSMGEGFCLPLIEAMATGLPCIYSNTGFASDYLDDRYGYEVSAVKADVSTWERLGENKEDYRRLEHFTHAIWAKPQSIIEQMLNVYYHYDQAITKGYNASNLVRQRLTWDISAKNLIKILGKV